jgi:hypothetical protein
VHQPARVACALALAALLATVASAQDAADPRAVQPERPTVATHAGTVAPAFLEIETGIQFDRDAGTTIATTLPAVFKTGLSGTTQLELTLPFFRAPNENVRFGDVTGSLKWRFADHSPLGRIAIQPSLKVPSGSESNSGTGTTDVSLLLIASQSLGPAQMDLNAGYTRRSGDGSVVPTDATVWTASFGGPAARSFGWVLEFFGYPKTTGPAGQENTAAVLLGPTFTARKYLVFDAGFIVPLTGWLPHSTYVGLTWNAGRL